MKNLLERFGISRCEIVVEENNLMDLLKLIQEHKGRSNVSIGADDWESGRVWDVSFWISNSRMKKLGAELKRNGFNRIQMQRGINNWIKIKELRA